MFFFVARSQLTSNEETNAVGITCERLITDVGDRRVYAGVHYPSDNLASWLVLTRLLEYYADTTQLRPIFWKALQRSEVFHAISKHVKEHSDSPLLAGHTALVNAYKDCVSI